MTRVIARKAVVFLDTCHSGAVLGSGRVMNLSAPSAETLKRIREGSGRVIITSSEISQKSWEGA